MHKNATLTVISLDTSIVAMSLTLTGFGIFLIGLAIVGTDDYPDWLGWLALFVGAAVSVGSGIPLGFGGGTAQIATAALVIHWVVSAWYFITAYCVWRKASRTPWSS